MLRIEFLLSECTVLPEQNGHPEPNLVLLFTAAIHSFLQGVSEMLSQIHHTFLCVPAIIESGVRSPFLVGWNSAASAGCDALRNSLFWPFTNIAGGIGVIVFTKVVFDGLNSRLRLKRSNRRISDGVKF